MFTREVLPRLRPDPTRTIATRLLYIVGLPEADCVDKLGTLTKRDHDPSTPLVGITASGGILTLRIRYEGVGRRDAALNAIDQTESQVRTILNTHVLPTRDEDSGTSALAKSIRSKLRESTPPQTLSVVESCTGGMLGETITNIPGSSSVFLGGHITYANQLKQKLGVDPKIIEAHGAVSPETAKAMAQAGRAATAADYTLAITGIAGPEGGTPTKPVGTVHIALATPNHTHSRHFLFTGNREDIRRRASTSALTMLHFHLAGHAPNTPRLLWQLP
jgi:nicotinamide-nucleotide amidase